MSKHTPGPWHVGDNFSGRLIVYSEKGWCVADCRAPHGKFHAEGAREANARLIAEAPAMLEALRKAEEVLRKSGMACANAGCAYCALAAEMRAILARIDGEG